MSDWDQFTSDISWYTRNNEVVQVGETREGCALSKAASDMFPQLSKLLSSASVTEVSVNDVQYELLAWDFTEAKRTGWLCLPPPETISHTLFKDHRILLESFGGIVERFNDIEYGWLENLNDALTLREAMKDCGYVQDYRWPFEDAGLTFPIDMKEYYSIALEANGTTTLCHRINGRILMFASDHCFDHLTELEGCPERTLYTINGAGSFREWVEIVANQWLIHTLSGSQ